MSSGKPLPSRSLMLEQLCSNRTDVVAHHGAASAPANDYDFEQFYVHEHLVDHNLVL